MSGGRARRGTPEGPTPGSPADQVPDADPEAVVRAIVLRQLAMAPRSRAQLEDKLASRDAPPEVVAAVLDRFEEVGLVDDRAYAEMLVRSQQAGRGLARRALAQELRRKGVDEETAAVALQQVDDDSERAAAQDLVRRRIARTAGLPRDKRIARLVAMLARKGYPGGLAMAVVREALEGESG